jgi:hypothetical protein
MAINPVSIASRWLTAAILIGLVLGGGGLLAWKLCGDRAGPSVNTLAFGEHCGPDVTAECGEGLVCARASERCLLAGGAQCEHTQSERCASGECVAHSKLCAVPVGDTCMPGDARVPCAKDTTCDPNQKRCVQRKGGKCKPGERKCIARGTELRICGSDGQWTQMPCPDDAPKCRQGKCQCSLDRDKYCGCGGKVQCDGRCSATACSGACKDGTCCTFAATPGCGGENVPPRKDDFNQYILEAVTELHDKYGGRGYSPGTAYTHDLDYAQPREIKAGPYAPATMCVGAVSEILIVALSIYARDTGDTSVFFRLPATTWITGNQKNLRPYIFMYEGVESNGTADALAQFGLGEHRPFPALVPGDFINFNRENGSGHAVVFLGFLNASGETLRAYDPAKVVGFTYFSAQGKNSADAGLGYRYAFFGTCPAWHVREKRRDCNIIPSNDPRVLNTGYMLHPKHWTTQTAKLRLLASRAEHYERKLLFERFGRLPVGDVKRHIAGLSRAKQAELKSAVQTELERQLPLVTRVKFDGETTDDY